jgi:CRISPR type III-associated protein (TIGR04423 family)
MKKQLEELWKKCENLKATGYFHPSNRQIKKEDIFINENIPLLASVLDSTEAFIIEGWILLQKENNAISIYIFRENDKYRINEFNIDAIEKEDDTVFIQEYKFIADILIKKNNGINSIKINKIYKKIKDKDGIYKIKPSLFYFNGFE